MSKLATNLRLFARRFAPWVRFLRRRTLSLLWLRASWNVRARLGYPPKLTPKQAAECPHAFPMQTIVSTSRVVGVEIHFLEVQVVCARCHRPYAPLATVTYHARIPAPKNPDRTILRLPLSPPSTRMLGGPNT